MNLTVDIMETFINTLNLSGDVKSFSDDGTNTTIFVDETYHARPFMTIDIDGTDYNIRSVNFNVSIEVSGVVSAPSVYTIPNPFYFHGTPIMTNNHISGASENNKAPMIYLYEIIKETEMSENSSIVRESDLRLFFLDSANFSEWETDDHYSQRLKGLNSLVDKFIEEARNYICCFYLYETSFTRINHANFGVYLDNKGHVKNLFDDHLTGVELSFTLPLRDCI